MRAKDFFTLLQIGGGILTVLIAFDQLQGRELTDAKRAAAVIGVATAVGPEVLKRLP